MAALIRQQLDRALAPEAQVVEHLCASLDLARATFYRQAVVPSAAGVGLELRDQIQRIALEWPAYGYRSITAELGRRGYRVNHKRVLRLMRQDNLLCLRQPRSFLKTTDSRHGYVVYPNLAAELVLTGIDQLWRADITYIRLQCEFVYLAVIIDAFSRRCIGWELSPHIDAALVLAALRRALDERRPPPGLVHHSDRGVQYACHEYTDLLLQQQIRISMSRRANPYDNAQCERFIKTLKYEEVLMTEYDTISEARASLAHFIEQVYNRKRLHSALGYLPPAEFEQSLGNRKVS